MNFSRRFFIGAGFALAFTKPKPRFHEWWKDELVPVPTDYDPSEVYKYTQIFRGTMEITRVSVVNRLGMNCAWAYNIPVNNCDPFILWWPL